MRFLTAKDIQSIITMSDAISLMKQVFAAVTLNETVAPDRAIIALPGGDSLLVMPAYLPTSGAVGAKIATVFPGNARKGMPTTQAHIILISPDSGEIQCLMEGTYVTALRTGATSALATDILAPSAADRLGVFGAGGQARTQIEGVMHVRRVKAVMIYDSFPEKASTLAEEVKKQNGGCTVNVATNPDEVVTESNIVVAATTSRTPLFDGGKVKPGTHLNAVGSFRPITREIDDEMVRRAKIFVDAYTCALKEAGDLIIPLESGVIFPKDIQGELGELILGRKKGRESNDEITLFKSVGMATQDMAVAQWIYARARERNLGVEI